MRGLVCTLNASTEIKISGTSVCLRHSFSSGLAFFLTCWEDGTQSLGSLPINLALHPIPVTAHLGRNVIVSVEVQQIEQ